MALTQTDTQRQSVQKIGYSRSRETNSVPQLTLSNIELPIDIIQKFVSGFCSCFLFRFFYHTLSLCCCDSLRRFFSLTAKMG